MQCAGLDDSQAGIKIARQNINNQISRIYHPNDRKQRGTKETFNESEREEWKIKNQRIPVVQVTFRKGRGARDKIANIRCIIEKAREFQKNIYFCLIHYVKPLTVWITTNWKILQEMGIPYHLTWLLQNLYAGQEATVRNGHGTTDWFKIGKGVRQSCILSPCLFNLYAEFTMRNAGLGESQTGSRFPREISTTSGMQMKPL